MTKTIFHIPKMDCPSEEKLISDRLRSIKGIQDLSFNLMQQELTVIHDGLDAASIQKILSKLGMVAQIKNGSYTTKTLNMLQPNVGYRDWIVLGIAGGLAVVAELFAFISHVENSPLVITFALASIVVGGRQTIIKGLRAVRFFTLNMNFLMTIAIVGAAIIGEWPEAAMVTFLFAMAEMIEAYSLDKARHAISRLMEITPDVATVKSTDGGWSVKPLQHIQLNDVIWVKPGERIPLDGVVIKGKSSVNQAPITGESFPVEKKDGDTVFAGSINERGSFEFKVNVHVNETLISKIIRAVQQAQSERAPTQRFVDEFARYYTPCMVLMAVLIAIMPPLLDRKSVV